MKASMIPDSVCAEVMKRAFSGVGFGKLANDLKTNKEGLLQRMLNYDPYMDWVLACKANPSLRMDEIREFIENDLPTRHIAELLQVSYETLLRDIHKIELTDGKKYLTTSEASILKKRITIYDVERFKKIVQVGESLVYEMTEDGVLKYCTIQKKCRHFAITDVGCVQWNWLCVKNERRLVCDDAIYT